MNGRNPKFYRALARYVTIIAAVKLNKCLKGVERSADIGVRMIIASIHGVLIHLYIRAS